MADRIPNALDAVREHLPHSMAESKSSISSSLDEIKGLLSSVEAALRALPASPSEVMTKRRKSRKKKVLRTGLVGVLLLGGLWVATRLYNRKADRE